MNNLLSLMRSPFLLILVALALVSADAASPAPSAPGIVTQLGRLQVAGNRIVGQDGQPVSLAGISFGWSQWEAARFYNADTVNWLKEDWHAQVVRAALGLHQEPGSYLQKPAANQARVTKVVDAAIAADLYVIIDWHDHHAHQHADLAVAFFTEMARRYGNRPNIIYEIFNEPEKVTWRNDVKPYAEKVIAAIRAIDPDNLIVVGTPNWSQDVDVAASDPIKDPNVAYTLHFYAGTHKAKLRTKAQQALDAGVALFVTEWGTCEASGDGPIDKASVDAWMDFIRKNQLSHCNWAVYDKKETAALLLRRAGSKGKWKDSDLTPPGKYVRELVRGWNP
jgi:endoglucanase